MSKVIRFHQYGAPSVLKVEDEQVGLPGPGQVRLRQEAIGVNFIDTMFRRGVFPMPLPGVTGVEGAGVVDAVGPGVRDIAVGDRMAYFLAPGAYAEVRLINATDLVPTPPDFTSAQVVTVLTKGLTAWAGLNGFYPIKAGDRILVQGALGGVGLLLCRWAKARGAFVIGTVASEDKRPALAGDVDHALASDAPDLVARIRALAPGGVDVVYEFVGHATFASTAACVRDGGTIVNIGAASGPPVIDQADLARRQVRVVGGPMAQHVQKAVTRATTEVFEAFRTGVFGSYVATAYALEQAATAHEDIALRRKAGPMILVTESSAG